MNIFDIMGPIMVGPSSSHTAGAARIGYLTRKLLGSQPKRAELLLHGSFAATGAGHGTDRALAAGLPVDAEGREEIRLLIESKSYSALEDLLEGLPESGAADAIRMLPRLFGGREVLEQAFGYLRAREAALDPGSFVLVHGDPHGGNALRTLEGDGYKLIDPDGLWYEKDYDLGVLLREWREDYAPDPVQKGKERCAYLHQLTGVDKEAIFQWGFLQCVSTGLLYWDIHRETGQELLGIAQAWLELEGNL